MILNTNDGTQQPPRLRCYLNLLALRGMPEFPEHQPARDRFQTIADAGYEGVQFVEPSGDSEAILCAELGSVGPAEGESTWRPRPHPWPRGSPAKDRNAARCMWAGAWKMTTRPSGSIEAVLNASVQHKIPLYVETHRATIFQDMWRTVKFVHAFPDLRFNGDFSHWYSGQEMVYGGFDKKLSFIQPVFERVRFIHGRISNPGCIQVDVGDGNSATRPYVDHFRQMWRACFTGFLASAQPGDMICFTPELLAPEIYYARTFLDAGRPREESNRWNQSLLLRKIAQECFAESTKEHGANGRSSSPPTRRSD